MIDLYIRHKENYTNIIQLIKSDNIIIIHQLYLTSLL